MGFAPKPSDMKFELSNKIVFIGHNDYNKIFNSLLDLQYDDAVTIVPLCASFVPT